MPRIKRKSTRVYAKGAVRRDQLLDAAALLLDSHELGELSLQDISEEAGIPVGSAYHFFTNAQDVYAALAQRFMESLFTLISAPYKGKATRSWQHLFDAAIDRGAALYAENPAYRQLIISGKAPPEIKLADRVNDERVGQLMIDVIGRHFILHEFPGDKDVFFFATEIVDLMFSLSVIRHGVITPEMLEEAKKAGKAYLLQYLPEDVPART
jgi:AcrR family transcriptional regulator